MGKPVPVADDAIAQAALNRVFMDAPGVEEGGESMVTDHVLSIASRVRFQPSTRQLVITLDLAMGDRPDSE